MSENLPEVKPMHPVIAGLVKRQDDLLKNLPQGIAKKRVMAGIIGILRRNEKLLACNRLSLMGAIAGAVQMGLVPGDPRALIHLVPYKDEVALIIDYKGYLDLLYRSGQMISAQAGVLRKGDDWKHYTDDNGEHLDILHGLDTSGERVGAFAKLKLATGGTVISVLSAAAVEEARPGHWRKTPWGDKKESVVDEMWKKTAIRRAAKLAPQNVDMGTAIQLEDRPDDMRFRWDEDTNQPTLVEVEQGTASANSFAPQSGQPSEQPPQEGQSADLWENVQNDNAT